MGFHMGIRHHQMPCPEKARARGVRPFRADNIFGVPFPGRCPGLSHPVPLGLKTDYIITHSSRFFFYKQCLASLGLKTYYIITHSSRFFFYKQCLASLGLKTYYIITHSSRFFFYKQCLASLGLKTNSTITHYRLARKRKRIPNLEPLSGLIFD
jgi:hypothetical protein